MAVYLKCIFRRKYTVFERDSSVFQPTVSLFLLLYYGMKNKKRVDFDKIDLKPLVLLEKIFEFFYFTSLLICFSNLLQFIFAICSIEILHNKLCVNAYLFHSFTVGNVPVSCNVVFSTAIHS